MPTPFPPQPDPNPAALARAQARLLAEVSHIGGAATEPDAEPGPPMSRVAWLGPQGAWEAAHHDAETRSSRYRFGEVFARGGLGAVRRAEDRKLGRTVAIKELLRFDDKAVHRFAREAAITARLQHPGIVPLYDLGRDAEGRPFLCMKLVEGDSLEQRITASADPEARLGLLPHVIAAADAIAYAHARGVIHRDLKPANILVGELGETVVIDWGLAKDLSQTTDEITDDEAGMDGVSDLTVAGTLLGTLRYMPPEQARGEPVDPRSDVYALGAVLYHVIAGVPSFHELRAAQLVQAIVHDRPRPLAAHIPAVSPALAAIVEKAMSRDPARRYADMTAFAGDLRRFQAGLLVGAHSYSPAEVARLWLRRHRATGTVAASALLAIGALGVVSFTRVRDARDAEHVQRLAAESARGVAEQRAAEAESARQTAARRADELVLSQARLTLETDPTAAFGLLTQLSPDPAHDGAAQTLATAAWSFGLTGAPMTGPTDDLLQAIRLSDGTWLASNHNDLWRWQPGATAGERVRDGGWLSATPDGDAWAIADRYTMATIEVHRIGVAEPRRLDLSITMPDLYVWNLLPGADTLIGASAFGEPTLAVDVATGRVDPLPGPDAPHAVAGLTMTPSADGRRLAGLRDGHTLVVWDRTTDAVMTTTLPGQPAQLAGAFTSDGRTYVQPFHAEQLPADAPHPLAGDRVLVWREGAAPRIVTAEWPVAAGDALVFVDRLEGRTEAWAETPAGHRLWTRQVHNEGTDDFVSVPHASSDGRRVLWGFGNWEEVVDVATGTLIHEQRMGDRGALLVDGDALLVPREHGLLRVDLSQRPWQTLAAGNPGDYSTGAVAPGGGWAVRHAHDELTRVDVRTGTIDVLPDICGPWTPEYRTAIDDAGRALIADDRGLGCLFGHGRTDILSTPGGRMNVAAFAPDSGRFAAAFDETVVEWSGPTLTPRQWTTPGHTQELAYAPDGSGLVALGHDGSVAILGREGPPRTLAAGAPDSDIQAIRFAPTGATLAVYHRDVGVTLHDLATDTTRQLTGAQAIVERTWIAPPLHHSPSGQALAVLDGPLLQRWSLLAPDAPVRLDVPAGWDFGFLDEHRLAVVTLDGSLELVETTSGAHAPLRRAISGRPRPQLARTTDGLVLLTWYGEVLRFTDPVPAPGDPLRAWLREMAVL